MSENNPANKGFDIAQQYQQLLQGSDFEADPAQQQAVDALHDLQQRLIAHAAAKKKSSRRRKHHAPVQGLYMWGGVGRGKTFLMDLFFDGLPLRKKQRLHFHRFMEWLHAELRTLQGRKNPIEHIADELASETKTLCFDEFFVSDITDAMLLGTVFEALFDRGVTLVATSNIPPEKLYEGGLQRDRFLPTIALLQQHLSILNVDSGVDYRLRALEQADIYHCPLDNQANKALIEAFQLVAAEAGEPKKLEINHRHIPAELASKDGVAWFEFKTLCETARSAGDYIEIARLFHTVLVANVPQMTTDDESAARRFINLIDEFYDRNVKLIASAAAPVDQLYQGTKVAFEFDRTISRMTEMQSTEYLGREHLP